MSDENAGTGASAPPASARRPAAVRAMESDARPCAVSTLPAPPGPDAPVELPQPPRAPGAVLELRDGDVETMRGVLQQALAIMAHERQPRAEGYRLVKVLGRHVSWLDVPVDPANGYAVLGAHARCDLVLENDPDVWLRHLAAIVVPLEQQCLGLRLIDLRTSLPFILDDGSPRRSALVRGPFAMRVGGHVVCGLPISPRPARDGALRDRAGRPDGGVNGAPADGSSRTRGAMTSSTSGVHTVGAWFAGRSGWRRPGRAGCVCLTLAHRRDRSWCTDASVDVPLAEFDVGMIVGRAHGCFAGMREISSEAVSRPHLLLLRERGRLFAFDLASQNGTRVDGWRIRRFRIPEQGAAIELGKQNLLNVGRWSADASPWGAA